MNFLEKRNAENLQDFAETAIEVEFLLDDGHEDVNGDGNPNLALNPKLYQALTSFIRSTCDVASEAVSIQRYDTTACVYRIGDFPWGALGSPILPPVVEKPTNAIQTANVAPITTL